MDFFFFVSLTAVMLLRPEELSRELNGAHFYFYLILLTTVSALPKLGNLLTAQEVQRQPVVACVLGVAFALLASALISRHGDDGQNYCEEFFKVLLYFLLLVAIIDTPDRLHLFMGWLVLLVCGIAFITATHYYGVIEYPLLPAVLVEMRTNKDTGEPEEVKRALASGIFADPNDLCLILTLGMIAAMYQAYAAKAESTRLFWLLPVVPLFFVLALTGSRGGMLGLLAGFASIIYSFYGLRAGIPLMLVGMFAMLSAAGGRGADISGGGTARERVNLWGSGLTNLLRSPLNLPFGLGPGWYAREEGLLAHNSFINAYVEIGIVGGGFFLLAFAVAWLLIDRPAHPLPEWARLMRPAMLAIVTAYAAGCFSLSRQFLLPTYLVLGLAAVYISLAGDPPPAHRVGHRWLRWVIPAMVLGLVAMKVITVQIGWRV